MFRYVELAGTAEERLALAEEKAKEERVELLRRQIGRRMMNQGLVRGWTAWYDMWEEKMTLMQRIRDVGNRFRAPEKAAAFAALEAALAKREKEDEAEAMKAMAEGEACVEIADDDDDEEEEPPRRRRQLVVTREEDDGGGEAGVSIRHVELDAVDNGTDDEDDDDEEEGLDLDAECDPVCNMREVESYRFHDFGWYGITPLHIALILLHGDCAKLLLAKGADPRKRLVVYGHCLGWDTRTSFNFDAWQLAGDKGPCRAILDEAFDGLCAPDEEEMKHRRGCSYRYGEFGKRV